MAEANLRILVIDDYKVSRVVACHVFAAHGHICSSVDTAQAALRSVDTFKPDVAILEWSLRDGTGRGLAHELRALSLARGRSLLIVVVSAIEQPLNFREAVDAYFTKPVSLPEVVRACDTLLGRDCKRADESAA